MTNDKSIHEQVAEILASQGWSATYEFPGYVSVALDRNREAAFGTADGSFWGGDVGCNDGSVRHAIPLPMIAVTSTNVQTIAAAIAAALDAFCPKTPEMMSNAEVLDIVQRALTVIELSEGADEHSELLMDLRKLEAWLSRSN